jgi:hypothetical protein
VIRFSRIVVAGALVLAALLAGACANETTGPASGFDPGSENPVFANSARDPFGRPGFTHCTPQAPHTTSARVGPSGGTLKVGRHTLRIPAGALKRSVLITMSAPSDSLNYVVFGPEGLTFDPASLPTLTMSYRNCFVTPGSDSNLEIVYTDDALTTVLDTTESVGPDTVNHRVGARLRHFSKYVLHSRYAVAY